MARCTDPIPGCACALRRVELVRKQKGSLDSGAGLLVMTDEMVLSVDNVSKRYGEGTTEVSALTDATIGIKSGEMVGIVGPSGSGKTTFLLIAGLLDTPTSGTLSFGG